MATSTETQSSTLLTIGSILVGLVFLAAGSFKLSGAEEMVANFEEFGLPLWLMYAVGATEVIAGGLLFVARARFVAALALAGTMVGAVGSHVLAGHGGDMVPSAVLLVALLAIAYRTRDQLPVLLGQLGLGARA